MNLDATYLRKYGKPAPYDPGTYADLAGTQEAQALWSFLNAPENVLRMETATELRRPAVEPLATRLLEALGDRIKVDRWKQLTGHMIRQVMERRGFRLDATGVRITTSAVFASGSRYVKTADVPAATLAGRPRVRR